MNNHTTLATRLLVAMPGLKDSFFHRSVVLVCEHDSKGAMGLVINRPLDRTVDDVLSHFSLSITQARRDISILSGGPLHTDRGFIVHRGAHQQWDPSVQISRDVAVTTSADALQALMHEDSAERAFIAIGHAQWSAGQLEQELTQHYWLCAPADSSIMFDVDVHDRWNAAMALAGVDNHHYLSKKVGYA